MLDSFYSGLAETSPSAVIIISIAIMLFLGFAATRLTKLLRLPNVTAYILTGIVIGPYCLNLIPKQVIDGTDFLADIALAFIAFGVGEFFKFSVLKKSGMKVIIITLFEACMASFIVFIVMYYLLGLSLAFSVVLGALAAATAPASTIMTIRQTHAHGDFVDTLLQVVALDDVVGLIVYSIAISVALSSISGAPSKSGFSTVALPIIINIGVLVLGGLFGLLLKLFMARKHSTDNRLIIAIASLFAFCGVCALLSVSPLLGCMSMGTVYINISNDDNLFKQLNYFSPPILLLFFVRSGLSFNLDSLFSSANSIGPVPLYVAGIVYFIVRIIGKYAGSFIGCYITKKSREVRNYLGLALIPQAGVAIGLAAMCARTLGPEIGGELQTIILSSSVLYEMIGPVCAKLSLYLSKSYSDKLEGLTDVSETMADGTAKPPIELLIERMKQIEAELPDRAAMTEEEAAFTRAAEDDADDTARLWQGKLYNKRRRTML